MKYLVVDGMFRGTGIRDKYNSGYIIIDQLAIPIGLKEQITNWLANYENEFFAGYKNELRIQDLDSEGIEIAKAIQKYLDTEVTYYSDGFMKEFLI